MEKMNNPTSKGLGGRPPTHGRTTKRSKEDKKAIRELLKAMAALVKGRLLRVSRAITKAIRICLISVRFNARWIKPLYYSITVPTVTCSFRRVI